MSAISKLAPLLLKCQSRIFLQSRVTNAGICWGVIRRRAFSDEKTETAVSRAKPTSDVSTDVRPLGEKIKETTKTVSYMGVILCGVGVTTIIFYFVFRELFSSQSPNSIYSAALEKCIEDPYVSDALGAPIKGYGEETTRRRRTHVSHAFYQRDGINCLRMQFYIRGTRNEATVQLDMQEVGNKYEYRYLFVQLKDYTHRVIILEDNRATVDQKKSFNTDNLQPLPSLM